MKVISTNIAEPTTILKNGKEVKTGIYKKSTDKGIYLGESSVRNDSVMDQKNHGGRNKACYLYSSNHYPYWEKQYPNLDWEWGMFGENITIEGLNESIVCIGDTFKIGEAIIQISEPRRPCTILGVRFGDVNMVKKFMNVPYSGTYVRILLEGAVRVGDELKQVNTTSSSLTIEEVYSIFSEKKRDAALIAKALNEPFLSFDCKQDIQKLRYR